jgi:Tol biopolymer transport system component
MTSSRFVLLAGVSVTVACADPTGSEPPSINPNAGCGAPLTFTPAVAQHGQFVPLVFAFKYPGTRTPWTTSLFLSRADGSVILLTKGDWQSDREPDISPDGDMVVFSRSQIDRYDHGLPEPTDLCLLRLSDGHSSQLTDDPSSEMTPRWSPDGSAILFSRMTWDGARPNGDIYEMKADGSGVRALTSDSHDDRYPLWLSGREVVFLRNLSEGGMFYRLSLDAGNITPIAGTEQAYGNPVISPDGLWLAYDGPSGDPEQTGIWLVPLDGSQASRLVDSGGNDHCPAWLPDGRLAFLRQVPDDARGINALYTMNVNGTNQRIVRLGLDPGSYWCSLSILR